MMIRFIPATDLPLYPRLRDTMFRARADQFRTRLGWDVTRVPFFEWDALHGGEAQDAYLRSKLAS